MQGLETQKPVAIRVATRHQIHDHQRNSAGEDDDRTDGGNWRAFGFVGGRVIDAGRSAGISVPSGARVMDEEDSLC